jgi:membrane-associated phospholipid phosphatase
VKNEPFAPLLAKSAVALVVGAAVVAVCYAYVDRPVAYFVYAHREDRPKWVEWLTYPPPQVQMWAPAALVVLMIRRALGPFRRSGHAVFLACLSLLVSVQFKDTLKYIFGRTWPETWVDNNPSLIRDGVSHFNFFHDGDGYASFPSGHAVRVLSMVSVFWLAYPRARIPLAILSVVLLVPLVAMNFHFVSDVVAGCFVGAIVGAYCARLGNLECGPAAPGGRLA